MRNGPSRLGRAGAAYSSGGAWGLKPEAHVRRVASAPAPPSACWNSTQPRRPLLARVIIGSLVGVWRRTQHHSQSRPRFVTRNTTNKACSARRGVSRSSIAVDWNRCLESGLKLKARQRSSLFKCSPSPEGINWALKAR